ncbi:MAG: hypothetical protein RSA01_03620 [Clostridium sp.]|uniref:hypothetical protein n=1 Tax=Clostridium sp. TaxID=1506 RepID=UPI002FC71F52
MNIVINEEKAKIEFFKYENGNTGFKIYNEEGKLLMSPTVDVGYIMNKEYVTVKNKDKQDSIGNMLKNQGVLQMKADSITLTHGATFSIYILSKEAREFLN